MPVLRIGGVQESRPARAGGDCRPGRARAFCRQGKRPIADASALNLGFHEQTRLAVGHNLGIPPTDLPLPGAICPGLEDCNAERFRS